MDLEKIAKILDRRLEDCCNGHLHNTSRNHSDYAQLVLARCEIEKLRQHEKLEKEDQAIVSNILNQSECLKIDIEDLCNYILMEDAAEASECKYDSELGQKVFDVLIPKYIKEAQND